MYAYPTSNGMLWTALHERAGSLSVLLWGHVLQRASDHISLDERVSPHLQMAETFGMYVNYFHVLVRFRTDFFHVFRILLLMEDLKKLQQSLLVCRRPPIK